MTLLSSRNSENRQNSANGYYNDDSEYEFVENPNIEAAPSGVVGEQGAPATNSVAVEQPRSTDTLQTKLLEGPDSSESESGVLE
jgi:hypothetical protein